MNCIKCNNKLSEVEQETAEVCFDCMGKSSVSRDSQLAKLGESILKEALGAHQWYQGGMRVAQNPRLSYSKVRDILRMAKDLGISYEI